MKHDYTDDELLEAFEKSEPLKLGVYKGLRAFLDALPMKSAEPERPQAQPSPWPGQQEAIDAAFEKQNIQYLDGSSLCDDWNHEAPARLAIAQAYNKARPQAAEIASLKAEREKWEADALRYCKNADFWRSEHDKAQAELAALRTPILADDGRSLGQVAMKASFDADTDGLTVDECYEAAAQAVAAVVTAQAIRRMEAVPVNELNRAWIHSDNNGFEAIRARLIAAAKGEGQAIVVNEPPKSEEQPDLSGESEKQDPYARLKAYAKAGARICTHDTEWTNDVDWSWCLRPEHYEVHPDDLHMCPEYAPQAEPPQPWTPDNAKAYEDFQAELRETWAAQPTTSPGWTPAVGDTVRLKSGGPVMTVTAINTNGLCAVTEAVGQWFAGKTVMGKSFSAACLTPAQP